MPLTTLYLVRHGETEYNRLRIMQGRRIDASLNATGRRQARLLGRRFTDAPLDAVYTSALRRTHETAAPVAAHHPGVPVHRLSGLDEMSWGVYEGEGQSDRLRRMLDDMYARWESGDFACRVEEGESILEVQERGIQAFERITARHAGEHVLVVTHGRFLRVMLATLLDGFGLEDMDAFEHVNTCVNELVYDGSRFEAGRLNCTVHLDDGAPVPEMEAASR